MLAFMCFKFFGWLMSVSQWDINISNNGIAATRTGLDSWDSICCTAWGTYIDCSVSTFELQIRTHPQNYLILFHAFPIFWRDCVFAEVVIVEELCNDQLPVEWRSVLDKK
jgi:hypothetical protein